MSAMEDPKAKLDRLKAELKDWNLVSDMRRKERAEAAQRQVALDWLRRTIFPVFEGIAVERKFSTLGQAAEYVVRENIRMDQLLGEYWSGPDAQGFFDSVAGRLLLVVSAQLLNEPDETTAGRAQWLLEKVLPHDDRGNQIKEAFTASQNGINLWQQTIVGIKRTIASRIPR